MTTTIVIDDRESRSSIGDVFKKYNDVTVSIDRLIIGDYFVNHQLLVERKTLADFAISIIDGRLFEQASRLADSGYKGVIILEGNSQQAENLPISREAMQGALMTVSLSYGIPILRAKNLEETAYLIICAAKRTRFFVGDLGVRRGRIPKKKHKLQLHILQGLPGVGVYRAKRLLGTFGSIENVMKASETELMTVGGVGHQTAKKIRWIVQ